MMLFAAVVLAVFFGSTLAGDNEGGCLWHLWDVFCFGIGILIIWFIVDLLVRSL